MPNVNDVLCNDEHTNMKLTTITGKIAVILIGNYCFTDKSSAWEYCRHLGMNENEFSQLILNMMVAPTYKSMKTMLNIKCLKKWTNNDIDNAINNATFW